MAANPTPDRTAAARQRLEAVMDKILPPDAVRARAIILGAVSEYTAAMIELCARPDDRWAPAAGSTGQVEAGAPAWDDSWGARGKEAPGAFGGYTAADDYAEPVI